MGTERDTYNTPVGFAAVLALLKWRKTDVYFGQGKLVFIVEMQVRRD